MAKKVTTHSPSRISHDYSFTQMKSTSTFKDSNTDYTRMRSSPSISDQKSASNTESAPETTFDPAESMADYPTPEMTQRSTSFIEGPTEDEEKNDTTADEVSILQSAAPSPTDSLAKAIAGDRCPEQSQILSQRLPCAKSVSVSSKRGQQEWEERETAP